MQHHQQFQDLMALIQIKKKSKYLGNGYLQIVLFLRIPNEFKAKT